MNSPIIQNQIMMYFLIADIDRTTKTFAVICDHIFITRIPSNPLSLGLGPLEQHRARLACGLQHGAC